MELQIPKRSELHIGLLPPSGHSCRETDRSLTLSPFSLRAHEEAGTGAAGSPKVLNLRGRCVKRRPTRLRASLANE